MSDGWRCPKCDTAHDPDEIKSMLGMDDLLEILDIELPADRKIPSLSNPGERTPSLHVYEGPGGYWDFSSGEGGDVIDFVMAYGNVDFKRACKMLAHGALSLDRRPGDVAQLPVRELVDFTERLQTEATYPAPPNVWHKRIGVRPAGNCWRADNGDLLVPHERDGKVYGVKVRQYGGGKSAWPGSQFAHSLYQPDGWRQEALSAPVCLVAEGESDCWALSGAIGPGATPFALPSGCSTWRDAWIDDLRGFETVWLCLDNDQAGKRARDKIELRLIQAGVNVRNLLVPQLFNDAKDAIVAGWQPAL